MAGLRPLPVLLSTSGLLGAADLRALAASIGLTPAKSLGQNFVIDGGTVQRIVRTAKVGADDVVLEIGPGLGSLTLALLPAVRHVVAVEIDGRLAELLPQTVAQRAPAYADQLTVLHQDAMAYRPPPSPTPTSPVIMHEVGSPEGLRGNFMHDHEEGHEEGEGEGKWEPSPTAIVANLPYNVAVPVLLTLLPRLPQVRRVLVMVQLEVAERLAAKPGADAYGSPSVKAAWYGNVRLAGTIGRLVFWPAPRVDSGLVALDRGDPPNTTATRGEVFAVVDAAFAQRRKTLRAALAGWAGSPAGAEAALRSAGIDPSLRGEVLSVEQFARIAEQRPAAASSAELPR